MSLQVCHCGWSKVTTHHGLRTHQGKMGCTPRGMRISEGDQYTFNRSHSTLNFMVPPLKLGDIFSNSIMSDSSDKSLQVCHCGWSSYTSYQGLRIHQGKMGCTPKGMRIPESEQYLWRNQWEDTHLKAIGPSHSTPVKKESVPASRNLQTNPNTAQAAVVGLIQSWVEIQQQSAQTGANLDMYPTTTDTTVKETKHDFFQTPSHSHQTTANQHKTRRALDFSTGAQLVQQHLWEIPTTTAQETAKDKEHFLKARQDRMRADLKQKIKTRECKVDEITSSVKACKGSLDAEWLEINNVFSEVMKAVEDARQKALQPLEERRRKVKKEAQGLIQDLKREIDKLTKTINELDQNPDLQVCPATGLDESKDWKNISVDTSFSFGTLRTTTSAMMEQIQQELEKLSPVELKRIPAFAVDVKLDPMTAHPFLALSDDGKEVRDGGKKQIVPSTPKRFDMFGSVLGINRLTSGKSYWEVEVSNKTGWDLGVTRGDANRKGKLSINPDSGYWVTVHYEGEQYTAMKEPPVLLSLKEKPQKVGVFVDYEEGLVSFYNVTAQSHIYSFTKCSFSGEIVPYFSPHLNQNGQNSNPLVISTVKNQ
ncbi:E3 ubiquitin-protein ligase TRIM21-like isoform X2 [Mastacembelus armatus]|uniref:E3 ubiquitin-protein ligase TRIM21-like isoform X2 n=1 Tax=Mastacembelus armatus TaxID=205130 RepID=UPI000E4576A1|nr:E3 ubiquitin-protein ligase TRIM21-like isoform X2 [Mastacembelus armatus]